MTNIVAHSSSSIKVLMIKWTYHLVYLKCWSLKKIYHDNQANKNEMTEQNFRLWIKNLKEFCKLSSQTFYCQRLLIFLWNLLPRSQKYVHNCVFCERFFLWNGACNLLPLLNHSKEFFERVLLFTKLKNLPEIT